MKTIINVTPHPITFKNDDDGIEFTIEPCGKLVNATAKEEVVTIKEDGTVLVNTHFVTDDHSLHVLEGLEGEYPDAYIVGSIIAAQAYPGRVLAMTPAKGYERVPVAEKRMNPNKFTTFDDV